MWVSLPIRLILVSASALLRLVSVWFGSSRGSSRFRFVLIWVRFAQEPFPLGSRSVSGRFWCGSVRLRFGFASVRLRHGRISLVSGWGSVRSRLGWTSICRGLGTACVQRLGDLVVVRSI